MATEKWAESGSPLDEVMVRHPTRLVQRVAATNRDTNRDIYDALEDE